MGVSLRAVSKSYGQIEVLQPTDLDVREGEFLTILGPSGSGKTTILRMIGGFTAPTAGQILFGGSDITRVPTHRRPFNTVFQDYALFPHLTVVENVAYGPRVRGAGRTESRAKAVETLEIVGLGGLLDRMPSQLSGGQRQRVALARAIVCGPRLILLDEPLSALDAEMRRQMQGFLKDLQRRLATTFLFVTHDQDEAMTMADRIVVMSKGQIEQIGPPQTLYYRPRTPFVARFFGENNVFEARIEGGRIESALGVLPLPQGLSAAPRAVLVALRPERIGLGHGPVTVPARLTGATFAGAVTHLRVTIAEKASFSVTVPNRQGADLPAAGDDVTLGFDPADLAVVEQST